MFYDDELLNKCWNHWKIFFGTFVLMIECIQIYIFYNHLRLYTMYWIHKDIFYRALSSPQPRVMEVIQSELLCNKRPSNVLNNAITVGLWCDQWRHQKIFCGGHRGGKMRIWGGKNVKISWKWLILAVFFFGGGKWGQSLRLKCHPCPPHAATGCDSVHSCVGLRYTSPRCHAVFMSSLQFTGKVIT